MRVLSLFDGMACGMLAFMEAGVEVERYDAYEIDKYAIQTATHNFPTIKEHGDVFTADFTEYKGVDFVVGGSPCTYWSIAQKNNRETEASGMGWELFQQYVRAIKEAEPKYFIYENNSSMSKAIRDSIDKAFGFTAVEINSALVSAQQRKRLYWVGKRNADGTYSKVKVEQPKDRGILLKDVLCGMTDRDKARAVLSSVGRTTHREYFQKHQNTMALEPVRIPTYGAEDKARPLVASYKNKGSGESSLTTEAFPDNPSKQVSDYVAEPLVPPCGQRGQEKSRTITAGYHICSERDLRLDIETNGYLGKQGVIEPVNTTKDGKAQCVRATCYKDTIRNLVGNDYDRRTCVAEPIKVGEVGKGGQGNRIYSIDGKSVTQAAASGGLGSNTGLYAIPVEFEDGVPTKAVSCTDGKTYTVYKVVDGKITIKDKQYPIKLANGYYIIRKLTVRECARLQTVPEWYEFPVSNAQAYKCLGNGWTILTISWLIESALSNETIKQEGGQLSIFDLL